MKLDLEKPYGTVHGDGTLAHYHQGDKYFDAKGNEVESPEAPPMPDQVDAAYEKGKADAEATLDARIAAAVAAALAAKPAK